jgi:hypothetical protein
MLLDHVGPDALLTRARELAQGTPALIEQVTAVCRWSAAVTARCRAALDDWAAPRPAPRPPAWP